LTGLEETHTLERILEESALQQDGINYCHNFTTEKIYYNEATHVHKLQKLRISLDHLQATHVVRHLLTFLTSILATVSSALLCNNHCLPTR
jgi:hypothetical protein